MRSIPIVLLFVATLLPGFAAPAPAAPAGAPLQCYTAVDIHGYTWSIVVDPVSTKLTGTWDTSLVDCPVYDVTGSLVGTTFLFHVSQRVDPGCDDYGDFVARIDLGTGLAKGTYTGSETGGPHDWTWSFSPCN